ncbi:hypothetical protein KSD_15400 [Ktedonobacter sp. SOSP1-85]|nr:hypothetical protein KSD_15400 [Ktedonobacter sp. SOSP1-85]
MDCEQISATYVLSISLQLFVLCGVTIEGKVINFEATCVPQEDLEAKVLLDIGPVLISLQS